MAYTSGTASNYKNLLSLLATFAAANGWTILTQSETEVYLRGEGAEGLDEIYCGVRAYEDTVNNLYNWELYGSINWRSDRAISAQPMANNYVRSAYAAFWNNPIPYWMVANARRIVVVAKVGTVYTHVHLGFIDPPATTGQYPYPLYIGGSCGYSTNNYSSTVQSAYWAGEASSAENTCCGMLYLPVGPWGQVNNNYEASSLSATIPCLRVYSTYHNVRGAILSALDGSYLLEPIFLRYATTTDIYGQINGIYRVSGYNNASENIITVDGVNYIVFQDVWRTGYGNYCAMRME